MYKVTWKVFSTIVLATLISFSLFQLRTTVVRAEVCPPGSSVGCGCHFQGASSVTYQDYTVWYCEYLCGGCGGGGNPMYIERTVEVIEWH